MDQTEYKEVLELYREQFPEIEFRFGFSSQFGKWALLVSDYKTYVSEDFREVSDLIKEGVSFLFFSVCLKNPKNNSGFEVII